MTKSEVGDSVPLSAILAAAVGYARRGWRVLPLHGVREGRCSCRLDNCRSAGKHPWPSNGLGAASADESQVREWWGRWPDANVAVATGRGLVVLDVDLDKGGRESIPLLLRDNHAWHTPTVLTGGGGLHFYFSTQARVGSTTRFHRLPGIDVRGEGGYVVAPPSSHLKGIYQWQLAPDLPLLNWPFKDAPPSERDANMAPADPSRILISEGERNDTLLRFAGAMRRVGMSRGAIRAGLLAENVARCAPPLETDEVQRIALSVERYERAGSGQSVEERLGALAQLPWIAVPVVALLHRQIGVSPAEFGALLAIFARHHTAREWGSWSQEALAADLGIDRGTLGDQLLSLRRKGLVAVRPDPRYGGRLNDPLRSATLHYCAEPYLAALGVLAARTEASATLYESAKERLGEFVGEVRSGLWIWEVDGPSTAAGDSVELIAARFLARIGFDAGLSSTNRESRSSLPSNSIARRTRSKVIHLGVVGTKGRSVRRTRRGVHALPSSRARLVSSTTRILGPMSE